MVESTAVADIHNQEILPVGLNISNEVHLFPLSEPPNPRSSMKQ